MLIERLFKFTHQFGISDYLTLTFLNYQNENAVCIRKLQKSDGDIRLVYACGFKFCRAPDFRNLRYFESMLGWHLLV